MTEVSAETAVNGGPAILHEGRYRLYKKPDGGIHLVYKRDDADHEDHLEIPGGMLRLAEMAGKGDVSFPQFLREATKLRQELK